MKTNVKYLLVSILFISSLYAFPQKSTDKFVIVLDAGHGGHDPGRPTKFDTEKKIALNIVLKLGAKLESMIILKLFTRVKRCICRIA